MGKRKNKSKDEVYEEYIRKKIRKLENKLGNSLEIGQHNNSSRREGETSQQEDSSQKEEEEIGQPKNSSRREEEDTHVPPEQELPKDDEELPEEFLLALGNEGEESKEVGEPIQPELALRWSRLMCNGLGKEAKEEIMKKYPTPENFSSAIAPVMNPEILASLSDITVKRDKRIIARQNVTGHLMTCLGNALTCLLKGNINSKILIEEINDAAKLAAEIFYQDSSSRKFFALGGANQIVREAVRDEKSDELLFGKNCAEKIKAAQAIKKTGSQIKSTDTTVRQQGHTKPTQPAGAKKQGNWKSPPQYFQQHRGRGGHRQPLRRQYNTPQSHRASRDQKRQYRPRANYRR